MNEQSITRAIVDSYYAKLRLSLTNDLIIGGAGPAGLTAAFYAARGGLKVAVIEESLCAGGGIWGGAMAMNEVVVDDKALPILKDIHVRYKKTKFGLYTIDACEFASGLCFSTVQAGVRIFNLTAIEDICVKNGRATGVVVNRTKISGVLPVDPIVFTAKTIVDATGHEAVLVNCLLQRGLIQLDKPVSNLREGPMDAKAGEDFVVDKAQKIYPGLWVAGMSVAAAFGGPRMGPIFRGMLLSGKRVADEILKSTLL